RRPALRLAEPHRMRGDGRPSPHCGGTGGVRGPMKEELIVGLVSVSDRASTGVYKDEGIPALKAWLASAIAAPAWRDETRLIPDEQATVDGAPNTQDHGG